MSKILGVSIGLVFTAAALTIHCGSSGESEEVHAARQGLVGYGDGGDAGDSGDAGDASDSGDAGPKSCCICRSQVGDEAECTRQLAEWNCDVESAEVVSTVASCYSTPVTWPEGCTSRSYLNACHGSPNRCDQYVTQFRQTIEGAGPGCQSIRFDTTACSLAGDLQHFLDGVDSVCTTIPPHSGLSCHISAHQTTVNVNANGTLTSSTRVTVCMEGPDSGTTYPPCTGASTPPPTCDASISTQTYTCSTSTGNEQRVCCPNTGGAYAWISGATCPPLPTVPGPLQTCIDSVRGNVGGTARSACQWCQANGPSRGDPASQQFDCDSL